MKKSKSVEFDFFESSVFSRGVFNEPLNKENGIDKPFEFFKIEYSPNNKILELNTLSFIIKQF